MQDSFLGLRDLRISRLNQTGPFFLFLELKRHMPLLFSKSDNPLTISRLVMGEKIKWPFDGRSSNWHVYVKQVPQIFYLVADAPM